MCDNLSPLEFTWLPEKLQTAGYISHFVGKGHLGYTTSDHLPINRGYVSHVGYLGGAEDYYQADFIGHRPVKLPGREGLFVRNSDFWHDHAPATDVVQDCHYSTNYYSRTAVSIVKNHTASTVSQRHLPPVFSATFRPFCAVSSPFFRGCRLPGAKTENPRNSCDLKALAAQPGELRVLHAQLDQ